MIAICLPSRGLVFSRTVDCVIQGMQELNGLGVATSYHSSHDLPIPDAHNFCVTEALKTPASKILFMEEDNFMFPDTFKALCLQEEFDVCTLQYNDKNGSPHGIVHYNEAGEVLWGGLGSTIVSRKVFESLGSPFFRTDHLYKNTKKHFKDGKYVTEYEEVEPRQVYNEATGKFEEKRDNYKYGGLDIDFYTRVRKNGFSIGVLQNHKGHHFELVQLGEKQINNGCHVIKQV